jgi:hypothetical protein
VEYHLQPEAAETVADRVPAESIGHLTVYGHGVQP